MAEISDIQSALSTKIIGADGTGAETYPLDVKSNQEAKMSDTCNTSALDTTLNLTTTAVEGKVGGARLVNRKYIWMQGLTVPSGANGYILWGFSNNTQNFKLFKDQVISFPIGDNVQIWFKVPATTGSVAFGEGA